MEQVEVDAKEVMKMFSEFDKKLRDRTFTTALRKSSNILKKEAVKNLKQVAKNVTRKDKYGNSLQKGIMIRIAKDKKSAKVHIMGNFKLKFFEMGTKDRYNIKKGKKMLFRQRYVGRINPSKFFTKAKIAKEDEVFSSIEQHLIDVIKKINDKYKNR